MMNMPGVLNGEIPGETSSRKPFYFVLRVTGLTGTHPLLRGAEALGLRGDGDFELP